MVLHSFNLLFCSFPLFKKQNKTLLWTENEVEVGIKFKKKEKQEYYGKSKSWDAICFAFALKSRCFKK